MPHVLIPVDFSETSALAARFGTRLAESMGLDLFLVHVFDTVLSNDDNMTTRAYNVRKAEYEVMLAEFSEEHTQPIAGLSNTPPKKKLTVLEGIAASQLLDLSRQNETALIVMGGVGAGAGLHLPGMYGSVANSVALRGGCPVVLIPKDYGSLEVERLAIAFDDASEIRRTGKFARKFIEALRPEVHFVHVAKPDWRKELQNEDAFLELSFGAGFPSYTYEFDSLPAGDVVTSLLKYTVEEKISLLVLANKHEPFWRRLFARQHLKDVVQGCEVPVLIIPYVKEEA